MKQKEQNNVIFKLNKNVPHFPHKKQMKGMVVEFERVRNKENDMRCHSHYIDISFKLIKNYDHWVYTCGWIIDHFVISKVNFPYRVR